MDSAPEERRLGDYRLLERLAETPLITTWLAEQVSVNRRVLVDELDPQRASRSAAFLADIRAKAASDHPNVGTVYEAVIERDLCFYAHELLPGATLEDRRLANEAFTPARLAYLLRRISDANLYLESHNFATSPLALDSIHLDDHNVIRLKNLVIAGPRMPEQSPRDIKRLGEALVSLVAAGEPGTTRIKSVLGWMRGEGVVDAIGWQDVRTFCEQIEEQLAGPISNISPSARAAETEKRRPLMLIGIGTVVALAAIAAAAFLLRPPAAPQKIVRLPLPAPVLIPAGNHPTPDGDQERLPAFRIAAHETTIGEYADFLGSLAILAKDGREKTYDPDGQPKAKTGHEPDGWAELYAAAKANGVWQGRPVTLDSPVVGVDWWDAMAYAEWKSARIPTQEEWFAAFRSSVEKPSTVPPGNYLPVTEKTPDSTPGGLIGMAGSVAEWTRRPAPNPSNPLGESLRVIIGGSYLKPASGALSREWTEDRSLRRPDLGFRVVMDP